MNIHYIDIASPLSKLLHQDVDLMIYYRRNQSQLGSFIRCPAAINTKQKARNLDIDMEPPVNWRLKDKIS